MRISPGPILASFFLCLLTPKPLFAADQGKETGVGTEEERLRRPKATEVPERVVVPVEIPPEGEFHPEAAEEIPMTVQQVVVDGTTLLPEKKREDLVAPVIGKTVTLKDLRAVAQRITYWYRGKGYVTSRAVIPTQVIERGMVRIRVIEGKVGQIRFEGNRYFRKELLARYLSKIQPGQALWMPRLEEALAALNAHPDRKVKLVLAPSRTPGTTDLVFQVKDHLPFHSGYTVDTLGTKATGQIRQSVLVSHGNLTGRDDDLLLKGIISEAGRLKGGVLSYLHPFPSTGLSAALDVSGVTSSVGGDRKNLLARGDAVVISPGLNLSVVRRAAWELEATTGFDFKRIRTRLDDVTSSKDDLRVLRVGSNLLAQDGWGRSLVAQELRAGIPNILGGSHPEDPAASRSKAGGSFFRWVVNLARVQQGPRGSSLVLRGSGQLTTDRLVAAEQFRLGGFDTVRGYPEGDFLADSGYQATVEVRTTLEPFLPASLKSRPIVRRVQQAFLLVGFWDFAEGFLKSPQLGEDADQRLSGVGCGFRLRPTSESVLQADWGWAIGDRDAEKDRPRLHLICRVGF